MSLKRTLAKALVYAILTLGALVGIPMRPDQIEKLMKLNDTKAEQVVRQDDK